MIFSRFSPTRRGAPSVGTGPSPWSRGPTPAAVPRVLPDACSHLPLCCNYWSSERAHWSSRERMLGSHARHGGPYLPLNPPPSHKPNSRRILRFQGRAGTRPTSAPRYECVLRTCAYRSLGESQPTLADVTALSPPLRYMRLPEQQRRPTRAARVGSRGDVSWCCGRRSWSRPEA